MRYVRWTIVIAVALGSLAVAASAQAHIPAQGSTERKAIVDGLRAEFKSMGDADGKPYRGTITSNITYIKVNGIWAWVNAEPRSTSARDRFGEYSGFLLFKETDGGWKVQGVPPPVEDPDDPENLDYPSAKDVAEIRKLYLKIPLDIFPAHKDN